METECGLHGKVDNSCSDIDDPSAMNDEVVGSGLVLAE